VRKARSYTALTFPVRLLVIFIGNSGFVFILGAKLFGEFFIEVVNVVAITVITVTVFIMFVDLETIMSSYIHCLFAVFTHGCSPPRVYYAQ
jgi:hypothetical protein